MTRTRAFSFVFILFTASVSFGQADKNESQPESSVDFEGQEAGGRKELVPGIEFRWCPAGKFRMGEDESAVDVQLTKGFWLGETEVTQGQWQKLRRDKIQTNPWRRMEGAEHPVAYISHYDAMAFCRKLMNQERFWGRLPKGWKYTLPTEAQWEYACRAGTTTRFSFGDDKSKLGDYGWFIQNAAGHNPRPVGQKEPNAWGLKDMHGNVYEWCSDWFDVKLSGGRDPHGPSSVIDPYRVIRGGDWSSKAADCRSASRNAMSPSDHDSDVGFRIAAVRE